MPHLRASLERAVVSPAACRTGFDVEQTIPFYREALRRTQETGVKWEVDHIVALCLGGQHIASNLQVLTADANREKAKAEKAEAKRRKT